MTYALAFRNHVLKVKADEKLTIEETSKRFKIGTASISRWIKRLQPKTNRNKPATKIDMEALKRDVEEHPDSYQYERAERFGVTRYGILHALKRLGVTYKKNPEAPQGMSRKTRAFLPKDR